MKSKIEALIARYNAGRLTQSGLYRRICALYMSQENRIHV